MSKTIDVDTRTFVRFWLVILGLGVIGLLIWQAMPGILVVLTSIFFAVALRPIAKRIDSIDKRKERRGLASVMSVVIVVISILAIIGLVGPVVVNETSKFLGAVPEQVNTLLKSDEINKFGSSIGIPDLREQIIVSVKETSQNFFAVSVALSSVVKPSYSSLKLLRYS